MRATAKFIETCEQNKNVAFWLVEGSMNNDLRLVVEVYYTDIYSAGYVYNITAYCVETGIKIVYERVKSYRNLLSDALAVGDYFTNNGEWCKIMTDLGIFRYNMTKKECKMMEEKIKKC